MINTPMSKQDMENLVQVYTNDIESMENQMESVGNFQKEKLAQVYNERGHVRYLQVEFPAAIKDFTFALQYQPDMPIAYYNRGLVHYRLGRFDKAIEDMKQTLALDSTFTSALQCLQQAQRDKLHDQQTRQQRAGHEHDILCLFL